MFQTMNSAFKTTSLEFERETWKSDLDTKFLVCFDAIFSLNQDLLLEYAYRGIADGLVDRSNPKTQRSWEIPGMQMRASPDVEATYPAEAGLWVPSGNLTVPDSGQPIFKLHGSSNWRTSGGSNVMILGGGKVEAIERFPERRNRLLPDEHSAAVSGRANWRFSAETVRDLRHRSS